MSGHRFSVVDGTWAVVRLEAGEPLPAWALGEREFVSVTRTREELSVVCPAGSVPAVARAESGWALLRLEGPFPFSQVGVLASIASPLAAAGVSIFAISTFDTDYVLVKHACLAAACDALAAAGHERTGAVRVPG